MQNCASQLPWSEYRRKKRDRAEGNLTAVFKRELMLLRSVSEVWWCYACCAQSLIQKFVVVFEAEETSEEAEISFLLLKLAPSSAR